MSHWYQFWILAFTAAGLSFILIWAIVAFRGISDLKQLIKRLEEAPAEPERSGPK